MDRFDAFCAQDGRVALLAESGLMLPAHASLSSV